MLAPLPFAEPDGIAERFQSVGDPDVISEGNHIAVFKGMFFQIVITHERSRMTAFPSVRCLKTETGNDKGLRAFFQNGVHRGIDEFGCHGPEPCPDSVLCRSSVAQVKIADERKEPDSAFCKKPDILRLHVSVPVHQPGYGNSIHMNDRNSAEKPD